LIIHFVRDEESALDVIFRPLQLVISGKKSAATHAPCSILRSKPINPAQGNDYYRALLCTFLACSNTGEKINNVRAIMKAIYHQVNGAERHTRMYVCEYNSFQQALL
jgi:hypothetical protein